MGLYVTHIETERGERIGTWELMRAVECYGQRTTKGTRFHEEITIWEKSPDDRLFAAIVNLGLACRWYADRNIRRGFIDIKTDKDGKDHRYSGEHDILENLINPRDGWENKKHQSLFFEYRKYLWRIRDLMKACEIRVEIGSNEIETNRL